MNFCFKMAVNQKHKYYDELSIIKSRNCQFDDQAILAKKYDVVTNKLYNAGTKNAVGKPCICISMRMHYICITFKKWMGPEKCLLSFFSSFLPSLPAMQVRFQVQQRKSPCLSGSRMSVYKPHPNLKLFDVTTKIFKLLK